VSKEKNKRVFVSDVHISVRANDGIAGGKHPYTWLKPEDEKAFVGFLGYLNGRDDVEEVVFIGDLFDNWVVPHDMEPPSMEDILKMRKNDEVVKALGGLGGKGNFKVVCLPGNHDQLLTQGVLNTYFPNMVFGGTNTWNAGTSVYRSSRLRAEHGSAHAMFNAPDPQNDPSRRLPLGYYISRVLATKTYQTGHEDRHWWTYADDMLELMGPEQLPCCVFQAILGEANLPADVDITINGPGGRPEKINATKISADYKDLYGQWKERLGAGIAFKSVVAEIGYLDDAADRLCKKNDTNIVIFGHSHDWELDKDSWFVDDRIYANCGCWCDKPKPYTYAEVETKRKENERWVRVLEWKAKDQSAKLLKEECVNL
jgi:UDP-2,3-diacylglucosamine pyrophosphatase LpxH